MGPLPSILTVEVILREKERCVIWCWCWLVLQQAIFHRIIWCSCVWITIIREMGKVVCVTGASGYIASWIVMFLLECGYTVKASVRDPGDPSKTKHLCELPGASEGLHLFKANVLDEGAFDSIVDGCIGVFHTASPCMFDVKDQQAELIDPAVKGTLNVLSSCAKTPSIKRVVVTSSIAAVAYNSPPQTPDTILDYRSFSDPDYCEELKSWYTLSKTLATDLKN